MCLLIHQPAGVTLPEDAIRDIYTKNKDGFGAIVNDNGNVEVFKTVGDVDHYIKMYNGFVAGKEAVIHFRMQTHGEIDIDNCHPYTVVRNKLWMAHNGVLSIGNPVDKKMSDTWHMIEYFIKPVALRNRDTIFDESWTKMLGDMIGNNRFAFMDNTGKVSIVNRQQGIEHFGCWLSNTYAWTPSKFGYVSPASYYNSYGGYGNYGKSNTASMKKDKKSKTTSLSKYSGYKPYQNSLNYYGADDYDDYGYGWGDRLNKPAKQHVPISNKAWGKLQKRVTIAIDGASGSKELAEWVAKNRWDAKTYIFENYPRGFNEDDLDTMIDTDPEYIAELIQDAHEEVLAWETKGAK